MKTKNHTDISLPKERTFGFFFVLVFIVVAAIGHHANNAGSFVLCLTLSVVTLLITLVRPRWLHPFNKAWFLLGILLSKLISPLMLGMIFFVLITPIALTMRLFKRDALRLRKSGATSYWVERCPAGPASDSFINQF